MRIVGVIPARWASTRFPGKPLALISGKPMIQWVVEGCLQAQLLDQVIVATDDERIAQVARAAGAEAIMTASDLPSGSDRIYQAIQNQDWDIVVNIQGDEPLVSGQMIDALAHALIDKTQVQMATLGAEISKTEVTSLNVVKILVNQRNEAIYFSRLPIPYTRKDVPTSAILPMKHIGMYAYRKKFLGEFCQLGAVPLEEAESLEQLRALYMGAKIQVVATNFISIGVDAPEDIQKIESLLNTGRRS